MMSSIEHPSRLLEEDSHKSVRILYNANREPAEPGMVDVHPLNPDVVVNARRQAAAAVWIFIRDIEKNIFDRFKHTPQEHALDGFLEILTENLRSGNSRSILNSDEDTPLYFDSISEQDPELDERSPVKNITTRELLFGRGFLDFFTERLLFPGLPPEFCVSPGVYETPCSPAGTYSKETYQETFGYKMW